MKYIKLFLISFFVFGFLFFLLSLLFPSVTYVSRAKNIVGKYDTVKQKLPQFLNTAFNQSELVQVSNTTNTNDTLHFTVKGEDLVSGAIALYAMGPDSTTVQVFYKIQVPWYQPWHKFGLMINEVRYGPSLDSALSKINAF